MLESDNTPDDFPPEQFELIAFCDACGHSAPIDRAAIPPGLTSRSYRRGCGARWLGVLQGVSIVSTKGQAFAHALATTTLCGSALTGLGLPENMPPAVLR